MCANERSVRHIASPKTRPCVAESSLFLHRDLSNKYRCSLLLSSTLPYHKTFLPTINPPFSPSPTTQTPSQWPPDPAFPSLPASVPPPSVVTTCTEPAVAPRLPRSRLSVCTVSSQASDKSLTFSRRRCPPLIIGKRRASRSRQGAEDRGKGLRRADWPEDRPRRKLRLRFMLSVIDC